MRQQTRKRAKAIRAVVAASALLFSIAAPLPAHAAPPTRIRPAKPTSSDLSAAVPKVLAALNASRFTTRQAMTRSLLIDRKLTLGNLKWLIDHSQTPEQLNRLLNVARHITLRKAATHDFSQVGAGSLGLTHQSVPAGAYPWLHHGAIEVLLTAPGFPAYVYLHAGDIITGCNGKPFGSTITTTEFKKIIEHYQCGDKISFTVHRGGKIHTITFPLASSAALGTMYHFKNEQLILQNPFRRHWHKVRKALLRHSPRMITALAPPRKTAAAAQ